MDLYSPVSTDTLEEYRREAVETLDNLESSAEAKTEALEVLTELFPIAQAMSLVSYSYGSQSDPLEALADVDMTDADYSDWYDSSDLESALREHVEDCESIPESIAPYIDWERYAEDHMSECAEFEHDGTRYFAL